jgi:uncharacterized RDD family membrane protein YckC
VSAADRRARAISVRGHRAGFLTRLVSGGIDLVVTALILFGVLVAFAIGRYLVGSAPLTLPRVHGLFTAAAYPVVEVLYLATAWATTGRTVGDQLFGLRVVRRSGTRLGKIQSLLRAVFCAMFGFVSMLWILVSSKNNAVHDIVFRTAVVYDWSDAVRTSGRPATPESDVSAVEATSA